MNPFKPRHKLYCAIATAVGITAASSAVVQGADADNDANKQAGLEEVVVTARYKTESLQDTPIAISAFNEDMLEKLVATDFRDIAPATPNVQIQMVNGFPNSAAVHIRGMGSQGVESTQEPRTGISIDGVYFTRPMGTLIDFFDVSKVEILRGPQGTSFGKNSLAGGIRVDSIKPSGEFSGKAEVTFGNYGREDYRVAIDTPQIADQLSFRLAYFDQNYEGHFRNRAAGEFFFGGNNPRKLGGEDLKSLRLQALWEPTENFDARFIYTNVKDRSDALPGDQQSDPDQLACVIFPHCTEPDNDPYLVGRDYPSEYSADQDGYTLLVNWDMGPWTLTSITGYIETDDTTFNDFDQSEFPFFPTSRDQVHEQTSQELRIASNFDSNLELVFGVYYMTQEHELTQNFPTLGSTADYATQDADSKAVFGQGIYAFNDDLNFTFGVRYTEEEKDFYRDSGFFVPGLGFAPSTHLNVSEAKVFAREDTSTDINENYSTDNTSFLLGTDYHVTDDTMVYFQYSEGFKAGEFGARANSPLTAKATDDETSESFELGVKSTLLDGRLRVNATVFNTTYNDLQFGVFVPSSNATGQETILDNLGEATVNGLELEVTAMISDNLVIFGSLGLLDAEYDSFCGNLDGPTPVGTVQGCAPPTDLGDGTELVPTDNTDLELSRAPEVQAYVSAEWTIPTGGDGEVLLRAAATYTDDYFSTGTNHPQSLTESNTLIDGSIGWQNDAFRVSAWGKNLTDEEVIAGAIPTAQFFVQRFWFPPKTYGVTASYRW